MSKQSDDLTFNVRNTVRTATQVLQHLEASLLQGGFASGQGAYETLVTTLVGQRLWAHQQATGELDGEFGALAAAAQRVQSLLVPYVQMMERLEALGGQISLADPVVHPAPSNLSPDAEVLLGVIRDSTTPPSRTACQRALKWSAVRAVRTLTELEHCNLIVRQGNRYRELGAEFGSE